MMGETADELSRTNLPNGHPIKNALIESFAVHARALIEFFDGKKSRRDDAHAYHYTSSLYQPFASGSIPAGLVTKINKQITHITESRTINPKEKLNGADIVALRRQLDAEVAEFTKHMLPAYQAIWNGSGLPGM